MNENLFPNSVLNRLSQLFGDTFESLDLPPENARVAYSQKPELGDYQCNGAMPSAKLARKNPRELATSIVERMGTREEIASLELAGPGFINIRLSDAYLASQVEVMRLSERLALPPTSTPQTVVVDFGGPNVAKPMHVGHLRSSVIGESLKRILRFVGHRVEGDIHLGDWGTQMGMLIEAVRREQPTLPYFDAAYSGDYPSDSPVSIDDLQRMYPEASTLCKEDAEALAAAQRATAELQSGRAGYRALWWHFVDVSIRELKQDFGDLGVTFDHWFGESDYHEELAPLVADLSSRGVAIRDAGALIVSVQEEGDKRELAPLLLVKSDGGYLYGTSDLATIQQRIRDFDPDAILYVVDLRQSDHFQQVFRAAKKAGLTGHAHLEHLGFGTVNGTDGRPFKTRAGGVMRLKDLMTTMKSEALARMQEGEIAGDLSADEREEVARRVGLSALKFADLQNPRTSDYIFDPVRFTAFEGKTGAYLCYAAVRIQSIVRKAEAQNLAAGVIQPATAAQERALQLALVRLPDSIANAAREFMPHLIAGYAFDLAQTFSAFYNQCHILTESDAARQASWLGLCDTTLRALQLCTELLGMEIPERM